MLVVPSLLLPSKCAMLHGSVGEWARGSKEKGNQARVNALAQHSWKESDQPAWLTPELFTKKIQPLLANVPISVIRSSIGVSNWYASKIRQGYRPHRRYWQVGATCRSAAEEVEQRFVILKPHPPTTRLSIRRPLRKSTGGSSAKRLPSPTM